MRKNRSRHGSVEVHVPQIVVSYIGRIGTGSMLIGGFLVWRIIETSAGSKTAADAAVIGLVMAFIGFGTGSISTLGAILASTRSNSDPPAASAAVTIEQPANQPVPVEAQ